jgi:hypothetical protein
VRVDLYSSVPTGYNISIFVNSLRINTFYDTVITVTSGMTAQQFSNNVSCSVRIKYDGPIYPIYLFAPGINVMSVSFSASDTSNTNPKYLTSYLNIVGIWNIVIRHSLSSAYWLTPFKIIV